ncbi:hypothetical protein KKC63_03595 [Patescibacteria group bacterium]|nr:hypothetical protein [Patescibacteria group bacterium]MBU4023265.1 hypothetical protein [Patescibacteria group bacterium]MBU4078378.1 hypothetical protein [Patescibacteria group bacterium]
MQDIRFETVAECRPHVGEPIEVTVTIIRDGKGAIIGCDKTRKITRSRTQIRFDMFSGTAYLILDRHSSSARRDQLYKDLGGES